MLASLLARAAWGRWWARIARSCGLTNQSGFPPALADIYSIPAGRNLVVSLSPGMEVGHVEKLAETLAAAMGVRAVSVTRSADDASRVEVMVAMRDPLGSELRLPGDYGRSSNIWSPVPIGVDERGRSVAISLPEHNLLIGGEPGAGKSNLLALLLSAAARDATVTLSLFDAKQVELSHWSDCASHFVGPDLETARDVFCELRGELDRRYSRLLADKRRKVQRDDVLGLHMIVIDELAYFTAGKASVLRAEIIEHLRDLVSRGRAGGFIVICATQKPSHDIVPTAIRDLFSYRLAMRCTTADASDTILGSGWASEGYSAASIDPANRGVGFLLAEGSVPLRMRAFHLPDEQLIALARIAQICRKQEGTAGDE